MNKWVLISLDLFFYFLACQSDPSWHVQLANQNNKNVAMIWSHVHRLKHSIIHFNSVTIFMLRKISWSRHQCIRNLWIHSIIFLACFGDDRTREPGKTPYRHMKSIHQSTQIGQNWGSGLPNLAGWDKEDKNSHKIWCRSTYAVHTDKCEITYICSINNGLLDLVSSH